MSFSQSQSAQINSSSLIHVQGNMHMYSSQYQGDGIVRSEYYNDVNAHHASPFNQPLILEPVLPPRPRLVIGRDWEVNSLVDELFHTVTPRLAILGTGGIGKTTVALAVLHDERVSACLQSKRYFVNCEGVTSSELLVKELADVLRIPPNRRDFNIFDTVLKALACEPAVLCLDNFETPWDDLALRPSIESALQRLDELQDLALLVTMRGIQRPAFSTINWSTSLEPLKQLDFEDAKLLFQTISKQMYEDEWSKRLLRAVDCIPLAVTLLAQIISEGTETTESLWNRWVTETTAVVENGGQDRLSKLDTSIQISVSKVHEPARQILGMIALLPDGLNSAEEHIKRLQAWIPNDIKLKSALTTLERKALIYRTGDHDHYYQMLTPIRHFTLQNTVISTAVKCGFIETYLMVLLEFRDANTASYSVVHPELSNSENILLLAFSMENVPVHLSRAAIAFINRFGVNLRIHPAVTKEALNLNALEVHETACGVLHQARNHHWIGVLQLRRNEFDNAEMSFKQALQLHSQADDVLGQGEDHSMLGEIHIRRDALDDAEMSFQQALQLHNQADDVYGQAGAHYGLGEMHLHRDELDDAEMSFKQALQLYQQLQYVCRQADARRKLGEMHLYRDELDDTEMSFKQVLQLHNHANDVTGQVNDHVLGEIHLCRDVLDDAVKSFKQAFQLYQRLQYVRHEADAHRKLGELHMRRDELDDAEMSFEQALKLDNQTNDVGKQGDDHFGLGKIHMRRRELDNALKSFEQALRLYQKSQYVRRQADARRKLGLLHIHRHELDNAEMSFKQALRFHNLMNDLREQANDHYGLGVLHMHRDELDDGLKSFKLALQLSEQSGDVRSQAAACLKLGESHVRRSELDDALKSFKQALQLYQQLQHVGHQADAHRKLGLLHIDRNELDDAEMSFKLALQLHSQMDDVRGQADDHYEIGEIHMHRHELDDALKSLKQALQLYEQLQYMLGQAHARRELGKLHLYRDELDNAEMSLVGALQLYKQIRDTDGVWSHSDCLLTETLLRKVQWRLSKRPSTSHPSALESLKTSLERFKPSGKFKDLRGDVVPRHCGERGCTMCLVLVVVCCGWWWWMSKVSTWSAFVRTSYG